MSNKQELSRPSYMKTLRTWDEWQAMGYGVMVGELPIAKNDDGLDMWIDDQVMKLSRMNGEYEPKPMVIPKPLDTPTA